MTAAGLRLRPSAWLGPIAAGAMLGALATLSGSLELSTGWLEAARGVPAALHARVGPVWIPMAFVAARVAWVAARAWRTRRGRGALGVPVRPELAQLAPLFAALGLCGTVWGLIAAFEALGEGDFLTQLPALLGGLGAAMTSTLLGLGLQVATLLLGVINPAWSRAELSWAAGHPRVHLDGRRLDGDEPIDALVSALRARQPEALVLCFDRAIPVPEQRAIAGTVWRSLDGAIPVREIRPRIAR